MTALDLARRARARAQTLRQRALAEAPLDDLAHPFHDLTGELADITGVLADLVRALEEQPPERPAPAPSTGGTATGTIRTVGDLQGRTREDLPKLGVVLECSTQDEVRAWGVLLRQVVRVQS